MTPARRLRSWVMPLLGAALVLGGAAACGGSDGDEGAAAGKVVYPLLGGGAGAVTAVEVEGNATGAGGDVRLERDDAGWRVAAAGPAPSAALLTESEQDLLPLQAYRRLRVNASPEELGLTDPQFVVRATTSGGKQQQVIVGKANFLGAGYYASRPGDPQVYLLSRGTVDVLRSLVSGQWYVSPRPAKETEFFEELGETEEPVHPWLGQALEEEGR